MARKDTRELDRFLNRGQDDLADTLYDVAGAIINDINASWSSIPSSKGGPPAVRTGNLKRSAQREKFTRLDGKFAGKEGSTVSIKYGATYAARLEFGDLDRPFLVPAINRANGVIAQELKKWAKRYGK